MSLASWNIAPGYEADASCCPLRYVLEFFHLMPRNAGLRNVNSANAAWVSKYLEWLPLTKRRSKARRVHLRPRSETVEAIASSIGAKAPVSRGIEVGAIRQPSSLAGTRSKFGLAADPAAAQNSLLTIMTNNNSYI